MHSRPASRICCRKAAELAGWILFASFCIARFIPFSYAQAFGGSPPWGLEKPKHIRGEVHEGTSFEQKIDDDLSLYVSWLQDSLRITVGPTGSGIDLTRCSTPPFHGPNPGDIMAWHFTRQEFSPGGVGQKRWFRFVLTPEDLEIECRNLERVLYIYDENDPEHLRGQREWGSRVSGSGWLEVTSIKLGDAPLGAEPTKILAMTFEAEFALYGALELWRLPARYVIPEDFSGWVTVNYKQKTAPKLPLANSLYTMRIDKSGTVRTSSYLRGDSRGAQFISTNGKPLPIEGNGRSIRCWLSINESIQSFYVGTANELKRSPNPVLHGQGDCSAVMPIKP
jgi:hypothetical protein